MARSTTLDNTSVVSSAPLMDIGSARQDRPSLRFERIVGALFMKDARIAMADAGAADVRIFAAGGELLARAGRQGDGPGEFRTIRFIGRYRDDSLAVFDSRTRRVSIFGADLTFGRSFVAASPSGASTTWMAGCGEDGTFLLEGFQPGAMTLGMPTGGTRIGRTLFRYDPAPDSVWRLADLPGLEAYVLNQPNRLPSVLGRTFGRDSFAGAYGEGHYIASSDVYEFRFYDRQNEIYRIVRRAGADRRVTEHDAEALRAAYPEEVPDNPLSAAVRRATEQMPLPEFMPAFGRWMDQERPAVMVDNEGYVWVLEYHFPPDLRQRWDVFDPSGVFLGTVEVPPGFSPVDVRGDRMVGVWVDADDVQHLRVYRLTGRVQDAGAPGLR